MMPAGISLRKHVFGLVALTSAAYFWPTAESHGFLLQPMGRSFASYKFDPPEKRNYNPQGANSGGKQHVYNNGQLHWPNGRFGVCGDPWDSNKPLEKAGRVTASYSPGTTITIHLLITANHWGRMEFNLCPRGVTAKDWKQRCTTLQRADGQGPHWTLPPGERPDPQGRPLIPAYSDSSFSYYIYPENDDFRDTPVYVVKYRLPEGFKCDASGCVLHWYWLTGNSCNPPCEQSDPLYPNCNRLQMGYCGDPKALAPEEFWGCSDIFVGDSSLKKPHINSSVDQLSQRLHSAHEQHQQGQAGKPQAPALPNKADYWRAELLEANNKLDATHHHGPTAAQHNLPVQKPSAADVPFTAAPNAAGEMGIEPAAAAAATAIEREDGTTGGVGEVMEGVSGSVQPTPSGAAALPGQEPSDPGA